MLKSTKLKKEVPSDDQYAFDLLCKDGTLDKEKDKDKMRGLGRNLEPDYDKCIEDFTARVDVKPLKESRNQELYNKIMLSVAKIVKRKLDEAVFTSDDDLLDDSDEVSNKIQDMVCKKCRWKIYINAGYNYEHEVLNNLVFNSKKEAIQACRDGIETSHGLKKYPQKCIVPEKTWYELKGLKPNFNYSN